MGSSSSSGSSQAGDKSKMVRYAPYVETRWGSLLDTVASNRSGMILASPYGGYVDQNVSDAMFGVGRVISDFPSLYDMFGKFLSGLDIEATWTEVFGDQKQLVEVSGLVKADLTFLDDGLNLEDIPAFKLDMRNKNAVISSSFVVGKSMIESDRTKGLAKLSAEARFSLLPGDATRHNMMLNWNKGVIDSYANVMKLYYMTAVTGTEADHLFAAKNTLWPFDVLDFERAVLGTMKQQAGYSKTSLQRKRSLISKILLVSSQVITGAVIGNMVGGPVGAIVGAVVGFVVGLAQVLME
jgi:hypothetical protein